MPVRATETNSGSGERVLTRNASRASKKPLRCASATSTTVRLRRWAPWEAMEWSPACLPSPAATMHPVSDYNIH
jgi:hypothetical protein